MQPFAFATSSRQPDVAVRFDYDIAVVGLDHRGLLTALAHHAAGSRVLAFDASAGRLVSIGAGLGDLTGGDHDRLSGAITDDRFQLTADATAVSRAQVVLVCVPIPVDADLDPDLTGLRGACASVIEHAVADQLLMLTSTTYVGCTNDLLVQPLLRRGFEVGVDVFVAFSAELVSPGCETLDQETVPRVVGGATPACEKRAADMLAGYAKHAHRAPTLAIAETAKLLENTFSAISVGSPDAHLRTHHPHGGPV